ncbi:undecaprenol kinase [Clostridium tepidiprofundi DSM 19306]|uniref:Undecaprenol kinase n=1 Tax=Clostridium tepidiprofundi DSM 19306 TaxID=1121338 RepID=A0A151B410_9CLOT|nr:diacylglycerol kinase [Clostridium tepidiprofundi]KYH34533.1 undecaprenol kinase [Clostridium tepidiprofundi DSM 19306]
MKKSLLDSFNYAFEGIIKAIIEERNMKIHVTITIAVLIVCFFCDLSKIEILIVGITISLVLITEMINTALEDALDAYFSEYNNYVKNAKDIAAGAVLISVINSIIVGYIIFSDKLKPIAYNVLEKIKNSNSHIVFLILIIVISITLILKILNGKGTPFMGGMPSGHSAVAFSIATSIAYLTRTPSGIILGFVLAIIVAQSRVDSKTHSIFEVILGGLLGSLITILIFQLLL